MQSYPTRLEVIISILLIMIALSFMGMDQINDEAKTAEVMASITPSTPAHDPQAEHHRQLAELDKQGRYMTSYDRIALNTARQP